MSKLLKSIAIIALVIPAFLLSQEEQEQQREYHILPVLEDHFAVAIRPNPSSEKDEASLSDEATEEEEGTAGYFFDRYPPVYYPSSFHFLRSVSALGDSLEIEDGSVWKVKIPYYYDSYEVLGWKSDVPIAVTQNTSFFNRSYKYRLVYNPQSIDSITVEANLEQGPIIDGQYTLYAADLNHHGRTIVLQDGSRWEVCSWDLSTFKGWELNDPIIVGFNSGWFPSFNGILINVSTNDFVRVRQF